MGSILGLGLIYPKSRVWFKVIVSLTLTSGCKNKNDPMAQLSLTLKQAILLLNITKMTYYIKSNM